jgi:hypothetical protein
LLGHHDQQMPPIRPLLGSWPGCLPHPLPNIMKMNKEVTWLEHGAAQDPQWPT